MKLNKYTDPNSKGIVRERIENFNEHLKYFKVRFVMVDLNKTANDKKCTCVRCTGIYIDSYYMD